MRYSNPSYTLEKLSNVELTPISCEKCSYFYKPSSLGQCQTLSPYLYQHFDMFGLTPKKKKNHVLSICSTKIILLKSLEEENVEMLYAFEFSLGALILLCLSCKLRPFVRKSCCWSCCVQSRSDSSSDAVQERV